MIYKVKYPVSLAAVFLWIGFVGAISFMEAWLKFSAPGITLPLGLGIGKIVFNSLNNIEWILAFAVVLNIVFVKGELLKLKNLFYYIPVIILLVQTFWLLPQLSVRADLYINDMPVPDSNIHIYYIVLEIIKIISLFVFGILQFDKSEKLKNIPVE